MHYAVRQQNANDQKGDLDVCWRRRASSAAAGSQLLAEDGDQLGIELEGISRLFELTTRKQHVGLSLGDQAHAVCAVVQCHGQHAVLVIRYLSRATKEIRQPVKD